MQARGADAGGCTDTRSEIEVDRPDVTNSSIVVPAGSLQVENGANFTDDRTGKTLDGTNTRARVGLGGCTEALVDLPDYMARVQGSAASGFSDVIPAIKHQLGPLPGDVDLSAILGADLPTGATSVAGHGNQPYLQFPWSREMGGGWSLSGQLTTFWAPAEPGGHVSFQPTFVVERKVTEHADAFIEYVGGYAVRGLPSQTLNSGGAMRLTRLQQLDFHLAFGLNQQAPRYAFGIGYSLRWDNLL